MLARARLSALVTDSSVQPRIWAASLAANPSTSRRIRTARCRGGSRCTAVMKASEIDSRIGMYRIHMPDGFAASGEFLQVTRPHQVVFTWGFADDEAAQRTKHQQSETTSANAMPPGSTRVTVTLEDEDAGTRLVLLQAGAVAPSASGVGPAGPCTARMAALTGAIGHAGGRVQHWRLITLGTRAESMAMRPTMLAELSRRVTDAAVAEAAARAVAVTVVTVDESGVLKELRRMDGAPLISVQTAVSKAYAAAAIGMPPDEFYAAIESDGAAVASFATRPGLALIGGGMPVVADGQVAGAVGVAGAMTAAEDRQIAEAAIDRARR